MLAPVEGVGQAGALKNPYADHVTGRHPADKEPNRAERDLSMLQHATAGAIQNARLGKDCSKSSWRCSTTWPSITDLKPACR